MKKYILVYLLCSFSIAHASTVIDTTAGPTYTNNGWYGSGQSLTVGNTDTNFDSFSFYADAASNGKTFDFLVSNSWSGGSTLFSSSVVVTTGLNTVMINQAMTAGSLIYALIDYNGFSGSTVHFTNNLYSGGNSAFGPVGSQTQYGSYDLKFNASFSSPSAVPVPAAVWLFGSALTGLVGIGKRKKAQLAAA
jgi:hypothetical protein